MYIEKKRKGAIMEYLGRGERMVWIFVYMMAHYNSQPLKSHLANAI